MSGAADRIDHLRAALIAYDVCRRALAPADDKRRAAMRPVLEAWVTLIAACRARKIPIIYTTPVSRADGADVVLLPTDLSVETGTPSLTNCVEGSPEAGFPDEIAPRPMDLDTVVVRECCWGGDTAAHAYSLDTSMKMYARVRTLPHAVAMLSA